MFSLHNEPPTHCSHIQYVQYNLEYIKYRTPIIFEMLAGFRETGQFRNSKTFLFTLDRKKTDNLFFGIIIFLSLPPYNSNFQCFEIKSLVHRISKLRESTVFSNRLVLNDYWVNLKAALIHA